MAPRYALGFAFVDWEGVMRLSCVAVVVILAMVAAQGLAYAGDSETYRSRHHLSFAVPTSWVRAQYDPLNALHTDVWLGVGGKVVYEAAYAPTEEAPPGYPYLLVKFRKCDPSKVYEQALSTSPSLQRAIDSGDLSKLNTVLIELEPGTFTFDESRMMLFARADGFKPEGLRFSVASINLLSSDGVASIDVYFQRDEFDSQLVAQVVASASMDPTYQYSPSIIDRIRLKPLLAVLASLLFIAVALSVDWAWRRKRMKAATTTAAE